MRNATHELIGVSLALAGAKALEADSLECVGLAAASLCGSRLPDIDQLGARASIGEAGRSGEARFSEQSAHRCGCPLLPSQRSFLIAG